MRDFIYGAIALLIVSLPVFTFAIYFIRNVCLVQQKFGFFKTGLFVFDGLQIGLLVISIVYSIIEVIVVSIWGAK